VINVGYILTGVGAYAYVHCLLVLYR